MENYFGLALKKKFKSLLYIMYTIFYYMTEDHQSIMGYLRDIKGSFTWWSMTIHQPGQCISLTIWPGVCFHQWPISLYKSITVCEIHSYPCENCTWSNYLYLGTEGGPGCKQSAYRGDHLSLAACNFSFCEYMQTATHSIS